jgi:hypothetical protein
VTQGPELTKLVTKSDHEEAAIRNSRGGAGARREPGGACGVVQLRMRFGIGMNTDHTLEEVGQQFSVTRERIRQIEAKALRKLKHPSRSRKMRSFLDQ